MSKEELYRALYTVLDDENQETLYNASIREHTLITLLGVGKKNLRSQIMKYNDIQKARAKLGNTDVNETEKDFSNIVECWKAIHHLYVCYLEKLKESLGDDKTINKILIYEAPPMPSEKKGEEGKINYILAESCGDCQPLKGGEPCEDCKINRDLLTKEPTGAYSTTIKKLSKNKNDNIQEILVDQGILFIDLCPLPLPMTTNIRKEVWGENFDTTDTTDKPLSIVLLELALRFALEEGIIISEKPIIAIGTPTATSQSIYLYFENMKSSGCLTKPFISPNICQEDNYPKINFSKLLETNKKYEKEEQILPLYKSNIIAGSNTPNSELLQRIFFENP
jgi:hypothetical protein